MICVTWKESDRGIVGEIKFHCSWKVGGRRETSRGERLMSLFARQIVNLLVDRRKNCLLAIESVMSVDDKRAFDIVMYFGRDSRKVHIIYIT